MQWLGITVHDVFDPGHWYGAILYAVVFLIAAVLFSRAVRAASARIMERDSGLVDRTVVMFLTQFAQIVVYVIALILFFHVVPALNKLGTALLTGVSVMSVIFGLAAQNTLGNLVAGCTLLLYRPFHIDDLIQVATPTGTEIGIVERLTLGYTMLRTMDDRLIIVPNSLMASQVTLNLNRGSLRALMVLPVGVVEGQHVGEVRAALMDIAKNCQGVHRIISCRSQALEDGSAIISLRAWCTDTQQAARAKENIFSALRQKFTAKISILLPEQPRPEQRKAA